MAHAYPVQNPLNVSLIIDGQPVSVPAGTLVVDAAKTIGVDIPIFCSHPRLDPLGACRMCLCEIGDARGLRLMTACTVPVAEGMIVKTSTPLVKQTQEATLAFILTNHPLDCPICDKGGECPLQDQTFKYGPGLSQFVEPKRLKQKHYPISDLIMLDQERCILCWRCIRYLEEWEDKPQLGLFERGGETIIDIFPDRPLDAKTSGNIIDLCPVGALTNRVSRFRYRPWEVQGVETICTRCAVGCNLRADVRHNALRRVMGRENLAVNDLWLCDKGRFDVAYLDDPQRLTTPLVRTHKGGPLEPVSWETALAFVAERLRAVVQSRGPNAVGAIGSARLPNEANYLLQKFMRTLVGSSNVDHRDGAAVAVPPPLLPPSSLLNSADLIVLLGCDPSEEAPVLDLFIKRAARRRNVPLLIAYPGQLQPSTREEVKIQLARYPGVYLSYRPGAEAALFDALAHVVQQTKSPQPSKSFAQPARPAASALDFPPDQLAAAAQLLAQARNPLILFGPLLTRGPGGPAVLSALQNLLAVSRHSQRLAYLGLDANSRGVREMGLLPNQLPGQASLDDAPTHERLTRLWNAPLPPPAPGLDYRAMTEGGVQALYIMGADPATASETARAALAQLDFLVAQDIRLSQTAALADVVLPAASSFIESDGTYTNLDGRVQRSLAGIRPPGQALGDWAIVTRLAQAWQQQMAQDAPPADSPRDDKKRKTRPGDAAKQTPKKARSARLTSFDYANAAAVLDEIARAVPAYADIAWTTLGADGAQTRERQSQSVPGAFDASPIANKARPASTPTTPTTPTIRRK